MEWWTESFEDSIPNSKPAEPWERATVSQVIELVGNPGVVKMEVSLGEQSGYVWVPKEYDDQATIDELKAQNNRAALQACLEKKREKSMVSWSEFEGWDMAFHFCIQTNLEVAWKQSQKL